jgi:hypothetical protein
MRSSLVLQARAPDRAGPRPRMLGFAIAAVTGALLAPGCATTGQNQVTAPTVLGMTNTIAPYYQDPNITLYEVQTPVQLPIRHPSDVELNALAPQSQPPYPRYPFLLNTDIRVEIQFTLSNLDPQQHVTELLLDPWNEFVQYAPGVQKISAESTEPNLSGYDKYFILPGQSRVTGTVTSDDTNELEVDLATAEDLLKNPPQPRGLLTVTAILNHIFNLQNRSTDGDPLITPYIPKVIAGLTGFDLGIRTSEPANVAVEISINVTDLNGNRVLPADSTGERIAKPQTVLKPPAGAAAAN